MKSFPARMAACALVTCLFAQEPPAAPTAAPTAPGAAPGATAPTVNTKEQTGLPKFRRVSIGFRVRGFPQNTMDDQSYFKTVTGTPTLTYSYTTVSTQPRVGIGPSFEFSLTRRISLGVELLYNSVKYSKTTNIYPGAYTKDNLPTNLKFTTLSESTKAAYLDTPAILRCRCLPVSHGLFSKLYLLGGAQFRNTGFVQTTSSTTNPDGTTSSNRTPASPAKRNLFGRTAGLGFKFMDDVGIKVMPEVRYTQWSGRSFDSDSTRSSKRSLEVSIAIIY